MADGKRKGTEEPKKTITFVTGNPGKLQEVQKILGHEINLRNQDVDLPELQGEPEEIAREKCLLAAKEISGAFFVEDTSLCYNALGGLPGPYVKWFLKKTGLEGLTKLLAAYEDKTAFAVCVIAYCPGNGAEPLLFKGETPGTIVEARGKGFGWDPVFQPEGFDKTYAEIGSDVKNEISHRRRAVEKLREYLQKNE